MFTEMAIALQISIIGMSLVFGAIVLLWALMAVLVRVTAEPPVEAARRAISGDGLARSASSSSDQTLRKRAAVVAVAVALARQRAAAPSAFALPGTAQVSTWQAVMRSQQLKQRGPVRR